MAQGLETRLVSSRQGLRFKLRGSLEFKDDIFDRSAYKLDINQHPVNAQGYIPQGQWLNEIFSLKYKKNVTLDSSNSTNWETYWNDSNVLEVFKYVPNSNRFIVGNNHINCR